MYRYDNRYGRFEARSNRGIVEIDIEPYGFGIIYEIFKKGEKYFTWFYDSSNKECEIYESKEKLIIYGELDSITIEKLFIRRINDKTLENVEKYIKFNDEYTLKTFKVKDFEDKLSSSALKQLNINMEFNFNLSYDGELKLFIKDRLFTVEEVETLISKGWLFEEVLDEWDKKSSPFLFDNELKHPTEFFDFIIEKVFGANSYVVAVDNEVNNIRLHMLIEKNNL